MLVPIYRTTWHYIPEDHTLNIHWREHLPLSSADGDSTIVKIIGTYLPNYTTPHSSRS
jgi:hypothetical protein